MNISTSGTKLQLLEKINKKYIGFISVKYLDNFGKDEVIDDNE
jgi:hypothetical protein